MFFDVLKYRKEQSAFAVTLVFLKFKIFLKNLKFINFLNCF